MVLAAMNPVYNEVNSNRRPKESGYRVSIECRHEWADERLDKRITNRVRLISMDSLTDLCSTPSSHCLDKL
jgi:hypothetical protein